MYGYYGYPWFDPPEKKEKPLTEEEKRKSESIEKAQKANEKKVMRADGRFV